MCFRGFASLGVDVSRFERAGVMPLSSVGEALITALVSAYRPYVERRVMELGAPVGGPVAQAVAEGEVWLADRLQEVLSAPFGLQTRGPLELFQEAMSFPTDALESIGLDPVERDPIAVRALPGDRYDLAPASSSTVGEEVWRAHLAWGAEKAAAMRMEGRL